MAKVSKCQQQQRSLLNTLSIVVAIGGLIVLSSFGEASPTNSSLKKSVHKGSRTSRSTSITNSVERSGDYNATFDPNEGKLCSLAGNDRPACRKAGLDMKRFSLELIRKDILKKLRLDENKLPTTNASNFVIPPSYLTEIVDMQTMQSDSPARDDTYDDEHATTEKIIAFSKPDQITLGKQSQNVHHFTFSEKMSNMKIESATLYVYIRNTHHHGPADRKNSNFSIRIRELIQKKGESPVSVDIYGLFKPAGATSSLSHGRHNRSRWVQIDIKTALSKWVSTSTSSRKITLVIEAVDNSGNPSKEVTVVNTSETDGQASSKSDANAQYPFIEVHVSESGRVRATRNIGMTCDENSLERRCCKYPLTVDFEEFGWDWIIAPKQYYANYCSGECPYAFLQKYPHNHIVQQAVPSGIGGPCCAARKMSSISMLYFDSDSNIVYSVLPGMVVEKCGCS